MMTRMIFDGHGQIAWSTLPVSPIDGTQEDEYRDHGVVHSRDDGGSPGVTVRLAPDVHPRILRIRGEAAASVRLVIRSEAGAQLADETRVLDGSGVLCLQLPAGDGDVPVVATVEGEGRTLFLRGIDVCSSPSVRVSQRTPFADPVCVGLATIPDRIAMLKRVLERIAPQVDHLFVYLNGFVSVPAFLLRPDVTVFRSQDFGDYRDNSKFFGLRAIDGDAFYLTVDDDIDYPSNYAASLVAAIDRHGRDAVVGYHGVIYGAGSRHFRDRLMLHFEDPLEFDMPVNVLGTGTAGFHTTTYRPDSLRFGHTGMVDLVVARELNDRGIPAVAVARDKNALSGFPHPAGAVTLFNETKQADSPHDALIRSTRWNLNGGRVEIADDSPLDPAAKVFLAFEHALRAGSEPAELALPWADRIIPLADTLGVSSMAVAAVRGRLAAITRWFLSDPRRMGASDAPVERAAASVLRRFVSGVESIDVAGIAAMDEEQIVAAIADAGWTSPAVQAGDAQLSCVYSILRYLDQPGKGQLDALLIAACRALEMDLAELIVEALRREGPIAPSPLVELEQARLRTGRASLVLDDAAALVAAGNLGRHFLAMAALATGNGCGQDLAEDVLATKGDEKFNRRLREIGAVLRAVGGEGLDLERLAAAIDRMPPAAAAEAASVLLGEGYWPASIDVDALPLENALERTLWNARIRHLQSGNSGHVVAACNREFLANDMVPIFLDAAEGSFFERLRTAPATKAAADMPRVSVIMATFNADSTIGYALRSVLAQSYANLEVVIVDDASATPPGLDWLEDCGVPVKLLRLRSNSGPYVCRNVAIAHSTGAFVTTHDADDWMHPQKIERQVHALLRTGAVASYHRHIRLTHAGALAFENNGRFVGDGPVTGMFRRDVLDRVGAFANVRTRGDVEFKARLMATFGNKAVLQENLLTLLALDSADSNSKRSLKTWRDELALARFKSQYTQEHPLRAIRPFRPLVDTGTGEVQQRRTGEG